MIRHLLILLMLMVSTPLLAQEQDFQSRMRDLSASIPKAILDKNIKTLGKLSLEKLCREILTVHWELIPIVFIPEGPRPSEAEIQVSPLPKVRLDGLSLSHQDPKFLPFKNLHESLVALGYSDEGYELTLAIAINDPSFSERFGKDYVTATQSLLRGVVRVNTLQRQKNLGDPISLEVKFAALAAAGDWHRRQKLTGHFRDVRTADLIKTLLGTSFVVDYRVFPGPEAVTFEQSQNMKTEVKVTSIHWLSLKLDGREDDLAEAVDAILFRLALETPRTGV